MGILGVREVVRGEVCQWLWSGSDGIQMLTLRTEYVQPVLLKVMTLIAYREILAIRDVDGRCRC